MAVVMVCVLLLLLGLAAVLWWGGLTFQAPSSGDPDGHPSVGLVVRTYVWYVTVMLASGLGAGILAAGAGGRLVMRLLAVTAGPDAQGRITEADLVVGRITADGTLGFILFNGIPIGLLTAALYLLLRRWLHAGRLGGLILGVLLLVIAGTRIEPLRAYSPLLLFVLLFPLLAVIPVVILAGVLAVLVSRVRRCWPPGTTVASPRPGGLRWLPLESWHSPGTRRRSSTSLAAPRSLHRSPGPAGGAAGS